MRRPTRSPFHRPAIQTLERLHSELGGQIQENKEEAQRLAGQMIHVEAVIKMLDPTFNLRRIAVKRRKPNPWFKRGTLFRAALAALRGATAPMTVRESRAPRRSSGRALKPGCGRRLRTMPARRWSGCAKGCRDRWKLG